MAGKNITIAGAVFNAVPSIDVPVSGGGTASFVEISDTTAAAADVAQGKYFYTAAGVKTEGTASGGGGGASNVVTGTFKGTATGVLDISIPYTGNGYPISVQINVKEGYDPNGDFYQLTTTYLFQMWSMMKALPNDAPVYNSGSGPNYAAYVGRYKTGKTTFSSAASNNASIYSTSNPNGNNNNDIVRIKADKTLSVYINNGRGFAPNIEYRYTVVYSS